MAQSELPLDHRTAELGSSFASPCKCTELIFRLGAAEGQSDAVCARVWRISMET